MKTYSFVDIQWFFMYRLMKATDNKRRDRTRTGLIISQRWINLLEVSSQRGVGKTDITCQYASTISIIRFIGKRRTAFTKVLCNLEL